MRHVLLGLTMFLAMSTSANAFQWSSGGGSRDPKAARVLAQTAVAASVTGTAAETVLATYTLKGGVMGPNGVVRVTTLWSTTNSSNNKTIKVKLAGTPFFASAVTTSASVSSINMIRNRNNQSSQAYFTTASTTFAATPSAIVTSAINTTIDQNIEITGQLANTGEAITLEGYTIELLPGS